MRRGNLYWNSENDRIKVVLNNDEFDLHCGMTMEVKVNEKWKQTRIEYADDWFLVGVFKPGEIPKGIEVRI